MNIPGYILVIFAISFSFVLFFNLISIFVIFVQRRKIRSSDENTGLLYILLLTTLNTDQYDMIDKLVRGYLIIGYRFPSHQRIEIATMFKRLGIVVPLFENGRDTNASYTKSR